MKRKFALLLVSGLLAVTLAGCGGDDKDAGTTDGTDGMVTDQNDSALTGDDSSDRNQDDSTGMENDHSTDAGDDGVLGDLEDGMNDLGDDLERGVDDLTDSGASYDQMVRNGSVHDTDGDLTDGENAHTPGAT